MGGQPNYLVAQGEALLEARSRYERGDITFDDFKAAFDAIMEAKDATTYQQIIHALPTTPLNALDVLNRQPTAQRSVHRLRRSRLFFTLIGELNKTHRPWRMGEQTTSVAIIGAQNLDLSLAELPQNGNLRVLSLIGETNIYVPRSLAVTVRAFTLIGEVNALGEIHSGIFSFCSEEQSGQGTSHHLTIDVFALIGAVNVIPTDRPRLIGRGKHIDTSR